MDEDNYWVDANGWQRQYSNASDSKRVDMIEDFLSDLVDDLPVKKRSKKMKMCDVNMPDANGKITVEKGCIFIAPTTSGFMLYSNPEGEVEIHCFADIEGLIGHINDNKPLDLTQTKIAENI